jgi:predicted DNA-binding protein
MRKMKEQYTVQLEPEFVAKLDKLADKLGISRSQLMRNLLESAYEDVTMLDKIGVFATLKFGQKLIKKIREGLSTGKIFINEEGDLKIRE